MIRLLVVSMRFVAIAILRIRSLGEGRVYSYSLDDVGMPTGIKTKRWLPLAVTKCNSAGRRVDHFCVGDDPVVSVKSLARLGQCPAVGSPVGGGA
jgi:hypothetical protein